MFNTQQIRTVSKIVSKHVDRTCNAVFFEKLKDGTRSIKVWHWSEENYAGVVEDLTAAGFTVKRVPLRPVRCAFITVKNPIRLHVSI